MSTLSSDFYPPSNRRRCVKGRPSYAEPSDNILFSQSATQDFNNDSQVEYGDGAESEDAEEEPITIDLSAFLNENPLLAQSAFESSAENNAAPTESSSQFRVTDCAVKSTENHKSSAVDESFPISSLDNTETKNTAAENIGEFIAPIVESQGKDCSDSAEPFINVTDLDIEKPSDALKTLVSGNNPETCTPESTFLNSISISSRDIPLNGKISPIKKFTKAKPLGLSNPLKKYKNFFKSKDLNKTNERVFGKYPVVKCEKLDIENFMKNNKIKISNWPLNQTESSNSLNTGKRLGLAKGLLKPKLSGVAKQKLLRKPISLDQYLNNSNRISNNGIGSIFNSLERTSKPIIIRTDSWKPEITNSATVPTYFKNLIKPPPVSPKSVLGDLLKLNLLSDQTVHTKPYSLPEKKIVEIKVPTVKKHGKSSTNYTRIAPKLAVLSPVDLDVASNNLKSTVDTLSDAVPNEYTVIEPYVDDPSSPQKPKPILTVPIELIASPEKNNIIVHPPINAESPAKNVKSVFLNGAFKQISTPSRVKKAASPARKSVPPGNNRRGIAKKNVCRKQMDAAEASPKIPFAAEEGEENTDILKAKNAVVDAMQIAIDLNVKKTKPNEPSKSTLVSPSVGIANVPPSSYSSILNDFTSPLGSSSYNSILNDFMVSGFSDFDDPSSSMEDESLSLMTPEPSLIKVPETAMNSKGEKILIKQIKRFDNSDTLSASECEDEKNPSRFNRRSSLKRKLLLSHPIKKCKISPKKIDSSVNGSNLEGNKDFVSNPVSPSHSFSHSKGADVSVSRSDNNTHTPSDCDKQPETNDQENSVPSSSDNDNLKQETRTGTLRERKCSSTEVDKNTENTNKQTQSRHLPENDKLVKITLNSKLKIQKKTPPRSTAKVKIKRKSCKTEDIIQEIKQITAGTANGKKRVKKHKQSDSKNNGENSNISVNSSRDDSESNSTSTLIQWKCRPAHSFSKKKRTLKVRIKRSKKKTCLKLPLSSLNDNAKNENSVSENNSSLTSSFREEEMGTPCKEENSPQNKASLSECSMEMDEKKEHLSSDIPDDSLVKSSSNISFKSDLAADTVLDANLLLDQCCSPNISLNEHFQEPIEENETSSNEERKCDDNSIVSEEASHLDDEEEPTFADVELINDTSDQNNNRESALALSQIVEAVINSEIEECSKTKNEDISEISSDSMCEHISSIDAAIISSGENVSGEAVDNVIESVNSSVEANCKVTESVNSSVEANCKVTESVNSSVEANCKVTESVNSSLEANCKVKTAEDVNKHLVAIENHDIEKDEMNPVLSADDSKEQELISLEDDKLSTHAGLDKNSDVADNKDMPVNEEYLTGVLTPCNRPSDLEQNLPVKESGDSIKPKKCPKIKIVKKNSVKLCDSLKNWFVSESQESEESDQILSNVQDLTASGSDSRVQTLSEVEDFKVSTSESFNGVKTLSNDQYLEPSALESGSRIEDMSEETESASDLCSENIIRQAAVNSCETIPTEDSITDNDRLVSERSAIGSKSDSLLNQDKMFSEEKSEDITDEQTNCVSSNNVDSFSTERENSFSENSVSNNNGLSNQVEGTTSLSFDDEKISPELNDILPSDGIVSTDVKAAACNEEFVKVGDPEEKPLVSLSESLQPKKRGRRPKKKLHELDVSAISSTTVKNEVSGKGEVSTPLTSTPARGRKKKVDLSLVKLEVEEPLLSSTPSEKKKARSASLPNHSDQPKDKNRTTTSTPSSGRKKNYDLELVRLPFNKGWMREHVIRATSTQACKPASDIYYFSPEGTKLRSMPDIGSYLAKHPEIDLSLKNFTFAKELIFREPFEIERDARLTRKFPDKKNVTPKMEVLPKKPKKSLVEKKTKKTLAGDASGCMEETVIKREDSPSSETVNRDSDSLNRSRNTRKSKQRTIDQCWNAEVQASEQKTRSSRKIVKKVPFDNSVDDTCSKRRQSSELRKVKIKVEPEDSEDTFVNSISGSLTTAAVVNNSHCKSNSLIVHFPKVNTKERSGQQVIDSSPFTVTKSNELVINKISDQRTNIKSPHIQSRLKVKLAHKKYEPRLLQKPCTRFCPLPRGVEPSVRCAVCLCLFHPDCIPRRPIVNFCQYTCGPCVKNQEQSPSDEDFPEFPPEFDKDILYPNMSLRIESNPAFDRIYNKFYSPVDPSFVNSCEGTTSRPMQICEVKSVPPQTTTSKCYIIGKKTLDNLCKVANPPGDRTGVTLPPNFRVLSAVTFPSGLNALPNSLPRLQNCNYLTDRSFFQTPIAFRNPVSGNSVPCVVPILPKPRGESPAVSSTSVLQSLLLMPGQSTSLSVNASSSSRTYTKRPDHVISPPNVSVEKRISDSSEEHPNSKRRKLSNLETDIARKNASSVWDIRKFSQIYECLNLIFKFLNVCDLLRASQVCRSWKHLASQKLLWENVSFAGMAVKDWKRCCRTLQKNETKRIDFRGICDQEEQWEPFSACVPMLSDVEELVFEKIPPFVLVRIADCLPHLRRLTCYCLTSVFQEPDIWSTPCEFEPSTLRGLGRLEALKISSMGGILLRDEQRSLMPYLPNLTHVVLTGFKFHSHLNLECLSQQKELTSLELGDCADIEPQIYGLLGKLIHLEHLCLQNGGDVNDTKLPQALSKMSRLRNLELMNFKISKGLRSVLEKMSSLQSFGLWPDSSQDGPQVNYNAYVAATSCGSSLRSLCWGILVADDDPSIPSTLQLRDGANETETVTFQELFQTLVKRYAGGKVEVKCLPKSIWSEFCSSRNFL